MTYKVLTAIAFILIVIGCSSSTQRENLDFEKILLNSISEVNAINSWSYEISNGSRVIDQKTFIVYLGYGIDQSDDSIKEIKRDIFIKLTQSGFDRIFIHNVFRWSKKIVIPKNQSIEWRIHLVDEIAKIAVAYTDGSLGEGIKIAIDLPEDDNNEILAFYFCSKTRPSSEYVADIMENLIQPIKNFDYYIE